MTPLKHPEVPLPPPLVHLGGLFVGHVIDRFLPWRLPGSDWLSPAAAVIALAGAVLALWSVLILRRHRTTLMPHRAATTLVTSGPFRLSRNPIYLSFALLHLACALSQHNIGMLFTLPFCVHFIHRHIISAEEAFHAQQFGNDWQHYRQRVRRWL